MTQEPWLGLEEVLRKRRNRKRWQKVVTALCALVVFCTTYALILPAITLEKGCPIPEHTHGPECYTQLTARQETTLSCAAQIHQHTKGCYDQNHNLACGYADFLVHTHEENCYDGSGNLRCPLREVKAHSHNENCYAPGHSHGEDCYTRVQGPLICGKHVHTDSCWAETRELTCGLEEGPDHSHGEECDQVTRQLTCGEADHTHGEECYAWEQELTCTQEETPVLTCREPEVILHRHTENCYDQEGTLVCGMLQILQHQHGEECFVTREIPVDTEELTCTDETHEHGPQCYGQWQLVCPLEEHTHDDRCTPGPEPEETEATEETGASAETEATGETEPTGETEATEETEPTEDSDAAKGGDQEAVKPTEAEETQVTEETEPTDETEPTEEPETPLPESTPSGLPVLGRAYAAADPYGIMPLMLEDEETVLEDRTGSSEPIDLTNYIVPDFDGTKTKLEYRLSTSEEWRTTEGATGIPGDAAFRLTVAYSKVNIEDLLKADCKLSYTLPDFFRITTQNGSILDDHNQTIGTLQITGQNVMIQFKQEWVTNQKTETNDVIHGYFSVEAKANLSKVPTDGQETITIGKVTLNAEFQGDLIARYGDVQIKKTVEPQVFREDGKDYLKYTVKVTAGADGCPGVKVQDAFGTGKQWVEAYVLPADAGATDNGNGTMTWTIGEMTASETRTLTYQVRLKEGYTYGCSPFSNKNKFSNGSIVNTATVSSTVSSQGKDQVYNRGEATATFEPVAKATLSKKCSIVKSPDDGSMKITYYIWVQADSKNSFDLRDIIIRDALNGSLDNLAITDDKIRKYVTYDADNFSLYEGGKNEQSDMTDLTTKYQTPPANGPIFPENEGKHNTVFEYHVGPLQPGQCRTLVYTVTVDPGAFAAAGNENFIVGNRVYIYNVNKDGTKGDFFERYGCTPVITHKDWTRKVAGEEVAAAQTIDMTEPVYDSSFALDTATSFTVPAGSQQYQVLVNEAGDWDLSSATLSDSLNSDLMQFVGYVKVDAIAIGTNKPDSGLTDAQALNAFTGRTSTKTAWVKIDKMQCFSFTPQSIGLGGGNYAYQLTYYAKSDVPGSITVNNTFTLSGTVGYGGQPYQIAGITSSAQVTVSGDSSFHTAKKALFYEAPTTTGSTGFLYWAIQVDGTKLLKDFAIKDTPDSGDKLTGHSLTDDSLVGVYMGESNFVFSDYSSISAVQKQLTPVASTSYTTSQEGGALTVKLKQDLPLSDGQSLYVLVKTQPTALPQDQRDAFVYQNSCQYSFVKDNWVDDVGSAQQTLYSKASIFKEWSDVFTYDGTSGSIKKVTPTNKEAFYDTVLLKNQPGEYVGWLIHLNYGGTLSGSYRVEETVPAGLEIAYIRMYWYGDNVKNQESKSEMVQISDLGSGWEPKTNPSTGLNCGPHANYYYVQGQKAIMEVSNLVAGRERDKYAVELQIVCKLVDRDVLQGGVQKEFSNSVRLLTTDHGELDTDVSPVTLSVSQLKKAAGDTKTTSPAPGTYPFVITVNEDGIDLMPNEKTITLVDELGAGLTIDDDSIKITNTTTSRELTAGTEWKSSLTTTDSGTQTLKIKLPDDQPLKITYNVFLEAAPGQPINITNKAHWEGYESPTDGTVTVQDYSYNASGGAVPGTSAKITIVKRDLNNTSNLLSGATFQITEMKLSDDQKTLESTETVTTGETDSDGTVSFNGLSYNTVYKIEETGAPEGYVLDDQARKPYYVVVAKQESDGSYPNKDAYDELQEKVYFTYTSSTYTHKAYNHKGEITVNKQFTNADGVSGITPLKGTYRFGLFAQENPDAGTPPLAEDVAVYDQYGKLTEAAKFTDVTLGTPYYVYELDDNGNAILPGNDAISNKIPFVVSYSGNAITVTGDAPGSVTVTNRINYPELPQTGGVGTGVFRVSGAAAALLAGCILTGREGRKRKRRENNET